MQLKWKTLWVAMQRRAQDAIPNTAIRPMIGAPVPDTTPVHVNLTDKSDYHYTGYCALLSFQIKKQSLKIPAQKI